MRAALIGKPLGHSYSKIIHERLGYGYDLVELDECEILPLLKGQKYNGFNVTIPYKKTVMPLLDFISDEAREIGSVNTVVVRNSRLFGYNTDYYGLEYLVNDAGIDMVGKSVLILGTGGTSATSKVLCRKLGASKITVVGRSSTINYSNCYKCTDVQIVINTTPVGMYPNVDEIPIDLSLFPLLEGVIDVVYNPLNTDLLLQAKALGVKCAGGLKMLVAQAVFASELFTDSKYEAGLIDKLFKEIQTLPL